jgi:hypothetical protein
MLRLPGRPPDQRSSAADWLSLGFLTISVKYNGKPTWVLG